MLTLYKAETMCASWHRVVLVLWFLQLTLGGGLAADRLCRRLMLTGLREDHTAYYMYAGIYEVQDYLHNGFPVLKVSNFDINFSFTTFPIKKPFPNKFFQINFKWDIGR